MARIVKTCGSYSRSAEDLFADALHWRDLRQAMDGLAIYEGLPDAPVREGEDFEIVITWLGRLPGGSHRIRVARLDRDARSIVFAESNPSIPRWDHVLSITPLPEGGALWTDEVAIEAGRKTFLVSRFAAYMYRRRHRRRGAEGVSVMHEAHP